jgi:hypothetical protein
LSVSFVRFRAPLQLQIFTILRLVQDVKEQDGARLPRRGLSAGRT